MKKAFSLIELMIVIIILGLLASLVMPNLIGQSEQAKRKLTCVQMHSLSDALKTFKISNGSYPTTTEGLNALLVNPNPSTYTSYPKGGFLGSKKLPTDPWKNNYIYIRTSDSFDIISLGSDKKEGGEEEGMDIKFSTCE
ncbi:type II secretion system major pseudopilin GspG [Sulfurospirillum arcachonense]|uniref:type II secretion system major pseudopilin GspG n=1 Tax=Sulfurospirillum arcachonense TaxID=57666 RepID=UPI00046A802C|nr:type II secretion system major pseudopilin GspG [Sulfurospirillum arcachonense]